MSVLNVHVRASKGPLIPEFTPSEPAQATLLGPAAAPHCVAAKAHAAPLNAAEKMRLTAYLPVFGPPEPPVCSEDRRTI